MTLAVIHGFASTSFNKVMAFAQILGDRYQITGVEYDSREPLRNYREILEQVEEIRKTDPKTVVVGASLGGLYASNCANELGLPAVLINPVVNPAWQFGPHLGASAFNYRTMSQDILLDQDYIDAVSSFSAKVLKQKMLILIGTQDDTVPPSQIEAHYRGKAQLCIKETDHRFDLSLAKGELIAFLTDLEKDFS